MEADSRLKQLEKDFQEKLNRDLIEIDFPESGAPIYVRQTYSAARKAPALKAIAENNFEKFNVLVLVQFALNEDGSYAFKPGHIDHLSKRVDSAVLDRVAGDIVTAIKLDDSDTEVKAAEKNSVKGATYTPDSPSQTT